MPARAALSHRRVPVAALLVAAVVLGVTSPVEATPTSGEVRRELAAARDALDDIDQQRGQAVDDYNEAQEDLDTATAQLDTTRQDAASLEREHDDLEQSVAEHVRRLYKLGPALEVSSVIAASDPSEAGAKAATVRRIVTEQRTDLDDLVANRTALEAVQGRLATQQQTAEAHAREAEQQRAQVEELFDDTADEVATYEQLLAETVEREEREERRRRAEEERRRQQAEQRQREAEQRARQQAREEARARDAELAAERAEAQAQREERERQAAREASVQQRETDIAPDPEPTPTADVSDAQPSDPGLPDEVPGDVPAVRSSAAAAVTEALAQVGKPYRWGGNGPSSFDCSGLMVHAWRAAGVQLPRTSRAQFAGTTRVERSDLQPGDLVFYHSPVSHVAMYIGNGQVVEAPNSGNNVRVRSDGLTRRGVVGFGRP